MVILVGVFGSLVGSFLNVVVYRVPLHRSIVTPPSACTQCNVRIKGYDNIPIISWLFLHGRCRSCKAAISVRYILVELGTALFFALVAIKFWPTRNSDYLMLFAFLYLAAVSVALALIDLDTNTLPNQIVLPSYLVGLTLLGVAGIWSTDHGSLLRAGIGMTLLWLIYFAMALAYPGGMGYGDVKLAGVLGLYLGYLSWGALLTGAFSAFLLGGLFGLALLLMHKVNRKSGIPYAPWMLIGAWIGVLLSQPIIRIYFSLFGIGRHINGY